MSMLKNCRWSVLLGYCIPSLCPVFYWVINPWRWGYDTVSKGKTTNTQFNIPEECSSLQHKLTLECAIVGHIVRRNDFNPLTRHCSVNASTIFLNRENVEKTKEALGPVLYWGAIVSLERRGEPFLRDREIVLCVCVCVGGRWDKEMVASLCSCGPRT
jgi:hypothetical protein